MFSTLRTGKLTNIETSKVLQDTHLKGFQDTTRCISWHMLGSLKLESNEIQMKCHDVIA